MYGARGGAPEGEENGNYRHGATLFRDRIMIGQIQFELMLPIPFTPIAEISR
jgi:hypothetical protein